MAEEEEATAVVSEGLDIDWGKTCNCAFYGRMGAGKSQLIRCMVYQAAKARVYEWILCLCPTRFQAT